MASRSWDDFFIGIAEQVSLKSKDPSTKVGCVLVGPDNEILSVGFNGFPRNVENEEHDSDRWERPIKYEYVEHAERNAIYNAARVGTSVKGARAYLNWHPSPCSACARGLIQAGIVEVIGPDRPFAGVGKGIHYDCEDVSVIMLKEAGVTTRVA